MQINSDFIKLYEEAKFYIPLLTGLWTVFKVINSFKEVRDNHLPHLQQGIDNLNEKIDNQTDTICGATDKNTEEIKELRGDIKMLTQALLTKK